MAGKRHVAERPASIERRQALGHWEIDTAIGTGNDHCIVTEADRATGCVSIGKLAAPTMGAAARGTIELVRKHPTKFQTITADNGTEFHSYERVAGHGRPVLLRHAAPLVGAGTHENTNRRIRRYLPRRTTMVRVPERDCNAIAPKAERRTQKKAMTIKPGEAPPCRPGDVALHARSRAASTSETSLSDHVD